MKLKKIETIFLSLILLGVSCSRQKPINFVPIKQFDISDSLISGDGKKSLHRLEHFIVENYKESKKNEISIDSFGKSSLDSSQKKLQDFQRIFYKSSEITNLKELKENPRDLIRYSQDNDLIYIFYYSNGKFLFRQKWDQGKIIEPKNEIKVTVD